MSLTRRSVLTGIPAAGLVAAACGSDGARSVSAADGGLPSLTPIGALPDDEGVHVTYAPAVPPASGIRGQRRFDVDLEVVESVCPLDPAAGVTTLMWGYRIAGDDDVTCGVPGPVLRGRVGDVARITLSNPATSAHPHNIDFHAVTGQGGGAAALTVLPGESSTIEARLLYPGAFMYHCAYGDVTEHIARGMVGMFIVDPERPLPPVHHEWAVMQSEWYVGEPDDGGEAPFDRAALFAETPKYVTFNGRTDALVGERALTMRVGERARIYMVNEGLNLNSNWHPIGSHWDVVYPEAATHPDNRVVRGSQSTLVVTGGGTVTELVGLVPSTVILVDHALVRTFLKGAVGHILVEGDTDEDLFRALGVTAIGAPIPTEPESETEEAAPTTAPSEQATVEVEIPDGAFDPSNADTAYQPREVIVAIGTTVTWTNRDAIAHTVTSGSSDGRVGEPDGRFDSGTLAKGETFSVTFDEPGTHAYYCVPHPWMMGVVVVEP